MRVPIALVSTSLTVLVTHGDAPAQPSRWNQINTATSPSPRYGHGMVYDAARQRVLLFGGWSAAGFENDTWEYDGITWTRRSPAVSPPARWIHAMTYDAARQRVVVFSGAASGHFNDTWEWDGSNWTQKLTTTAPHPQQGAAMAFHPGSGKTVFFGGSETWEWDGSAWALRSPVGLPPGRDNHTMTHHYSTGRTIAFGGWIPRFSDTWAWDGAQWTLEAPAFSPPPRMNHAIASDPDRGVLVLFGGSIATGMTGDTWEWDGTSWTEIHPAGAPTNRNLHAMAYDEVRRRVVLFGGDGQTRLGDTWEYEVLVAASYSLVGPGCPGSSTGVPLLANQGLPVLGQSLRLDVTGAPRIAPGALFFSATATSFDLGQIGAPGCTAYANAHVVVPFVTDFNGVWFNPPAFSIPNQAGLVGGMFWNQAFVADQPANRLGVIASQGWKATIGY